MSDTSSIMKNETFLTVAIFQHFTEAQIIKGRLEADGIKVFLSDNPTMDTDPLVSKAIGGIKLKVLSHQGVEAQNILNAIPSYRLEPEDLAIKCPNCRSTYIEIFSTIKDLKSLFRFIFGVLFSSLPVHTKHKYRCEMCETEFDLK